ncbi:hypothetical protein LGAA44_80034 [Leuconostoc gasicomitatum]|nr:hypothetical protein LGAA44_80034 [Leuconostoc gasicomitatum]
MMRKRIDLKKLVLMFIIADA